MPNIVAVDQQSKGNIKELGQLIRDCRGTLSQSKLAKKVGLPRSNMKYIEDGVNRRARNTQPCIFQKGNE